MANPVVDAVGACVALSVQGSSGVDLDGVDDSPELGRADGQDSLAATEVQHSPGPGAPGERGYRLKTELRRFVRPVPEPEAWVDDEPDLIALVPAERRDNSPMRGDDDADPFWTSHFHDLPRPEYAAFPSGPPVAAPPTVLPSVPQTWLSGPTRLVAPGSPALRTSVPIDDVALAALSSLVPRSTTNHGEARDLEEEQAALEE